MVREHVTILRVHDLYYSYYDYLCIVFFCFFFGGGASNSLGLRICIESSCVGWVVAIAALSAQGAFSWPLFKDCLPELDLLAFIFGTMISFRAMWYRTKTIALQIERH